MLSNVFSKIKLATLFIFVSLLNAAYALNTSMPSEVQNKTNDMEGTVVWGITIGGIVAICCRFYAIHKNKGQGGWVEYVAWTLIGIAMMIVVITWWVAKAKSATSGFMI